MAEQQTDMREYLEHILEQDPKRALALAMEETARVKASVKSSVKLDRQGRITEADMDGLYRMGLLYSRTRLVPEHFQGKAEDCAIACGLAMRWGLDPLMVMQSSYIVHGRPGIEGKLMIALLNASGKIKGRLRFRLEGEGKDRKCTCYATDAETGEEVAAVVTWEMAEAEGWTKDSKTKSGATIKSKWNTLPDLMFQYRSAAFLARVNYPEVLMGMRTTDELAEEGPPEETNHRPRTIDDLKDKLDTMEAALPPVGVVDHTGPVPTDEELAAEDTDDLEQFRLAIRRKLDRCKDVPSLEKLAGELSRANKEDEGRYSIVLDEVALRDADLDEARQEAEVNT